MEDQPIASSPAIPEQMGGAVPAPDNPDAAIPPLHMPVYQGYSKEAVSQLFKDPRIHEAVKKFVGVDLPKKIYEKDYALIVKLRNLIDQYGVDNTVKIAHQSVPQNLKLQLKALALDVAKKRQVHAQRKEK